MTTFRITGGVLQGEAAGSNYPDNTLPPGEGIVDPGYGIGIGHPSHPIVLPPPPPGVWPPPVIAHPIVPAPPGTPPGTIWPGPTPMPPIARPPGGSGKPPYPDQSPPTDQPHPDQGLPGAQPGPDQGLPGSQPHPDQGLPGQQPPAGGGPVDPGYDTGGNRPSHPIAQPEGTLWVVVWIPGYGWNYVAVNPSLKPSHPIAGGEHPSHQPVPHPDQGLPGEGQPQPQPH